VAKKRTTRKKPLSSGKAKHATEIRRAKRAVSAASTRGSLASSAPDAQPAGGAAVPQLERVPSLMKRLVRAVGSPFASSAAEAGLSGARTSPAEKSALSVFANPLADVARRHVREAVQFRPDISATDAHCRRILTNLAEARIYAVLKPCPNHDHLLSDSPSSLTDSGGPANG